MFDDYNSNKTLVRILESWATTDNPFNSTEEILAWIHEKNQETNVNIKKISYDYNGDWHYDKDEKGIVNRAKTFFKIVGLTKEDSTSYYEQPIIIQNEIGYLGIIGRVIDGVLYFLMQAKIEPGNVNCIQISPTLQATKSNFIRAHGGRSPAYLEYFSNKRNYEIVVDQIQSEQSSRFLGKRNRNIIIIVDDDIDVLETHKWMTLGQIKQLMHYDNLVNMDTRTVLSCIPLSLRDFSYKEISHVRTLFTSDSFFNSVFFGASGKEINLIYQYLNEVKMLEQSRINTVDLYSLRDWHMQNGVFCCRHEAEFQVVFCDIEIEGREVRKWQQPLIEATGQSTYGLFYRIDKGKMEFLVRAKSEVGCFDKVEIGPSIQLGPNEKSQGNSFEMWLWQCIISKTGLVFEGLFSEEGGRFYHEQNRDVIIKVGAEQLPELPEDYMWADYQTLNILVQFNNCLNIQLRNLLSILEIK